MRAIQIERVLYKAFIDNVEKALIEGEANYGCSFRNVEELSDFLTNYKLKITSISPINDTGNFGIFFRIDDHLLYIDMTGTISARS